MKAVRFFETSGEKNYPILGGNSADDLVPKQSLAEPQMTVFVLLII